jgi:hypothetical protein
LSGAVPSGSAAHARRISVRRRSGARVVYLTTKGFEDTPYYGFFAPAGTPPAFVDAFSSALARVLAMPDVQERLTAMGLTIDFMTQRELDARERAYTRTWKEIIRKSGFQPLN